MATKKTLKIAFDMSNGTTKTYSLLDPKNNLSLTEVNNFSDLVIQKNAVKVNNATISNLGDAYIEEVTRTELV